jgi:TetR/AcrR family transcriptional regulator
VSPVVPSRPAERDGARAILEAATRLFADEGFEPVSVARIAETAGVCKANVFHHFASKEALYLAVMQLASAEHAERAEALLDQPGPCADKVRELFAFELNWMLERPVFARLILRECSDQGHPQARELARQTFARNFHAINALFEQGHARGEFRSDIEPAAVTLSLFAAKHFFMQQREGLSASAEIGDLIRPDVYVDRICSIVLDGIVSRRKLSTSSRPGRSRPAKPKSRTLTK